MTSEVRIHLRIIPLSSHVYALNNSFGKLRPVHLHPSIVSNKTLSDPVLQSIFNNKCILDISFVCSWRTRVGAAPAFVNFALTADGRSWMRCACAWWGLSKLRARVRTASGERSDQIHHYRWLPSAVCALATATCLHVRPSDSQGPKIYMKQKYKTKLY